MQHEPAKRTPVQLSAGILQIGQHLHIARCITFLASTRFAVVRRDVVNLLQILVQPGLSASLLVGITTLCNRCRNENTFIFST